MTRRTILVDAAVVAVALTEGLFGLYTSSPAELILTTIAAVGLATRRVSPWLSLVLSLPALFIAGGPIAPIVALGTLAVAGTTPWVLTAAGLVVLVGMLAPWAGYPNINVFVLALVNATMTAGGSIAIGLLLRTRSQLTTTLTELNQTRVSERDSIQREAVATERARLAREMHDVVSHQVSLIAVCSAALQVRTREDETVATAREIRGLAAKTLDELRQMIRVLSAAGAGPTGLEPQPTIDGLDALIAGSRLPVELRTTDLNDLPAPIQRAVFRTVQESLTNVHKHAPGSPLVVVEIRRRHDFVVVTVWNAPGTAPAMDPPLPSSRHGHLGLSQRVSLLGGEFSAAPAADGGYTVSASIPVPPSGLR